MFSDADGSTLINELNKLLQALADGAIGSRYLAASLVTRPQPRFRIA